MSSIEPKAANMRLQRALEPVLAHQLSRRMRIARYAYSGGILLIPPLASVWALQRAWSSGLHAIDLMFLGVMYAASQLGITLGYHRYLSHHAFEPCPALELALLVLGATAGQGPPIHWAADHRRHHQFADEDGDPHSPHCDGGLRLDGWRGFWHAHLGWTFTHALTNTLFYCRDLQRNPRVRFVQRHYGLWLLLGLALPAAAGLALSRDAAGLLSGLLWGGFVRLTLAYHATMLINSITHMAGARPFDTRDRSRNAAWLALPTFGESWHNNHHAFPSSAYFGLNAAELDPGAWFVRAFAALGLVSRAKRPSAYAIEARRRERGSRRQNVTEVV